MIEKAPAWNTTDPYAHTCEEAGFQSEPGELCFGYVGEA